MQQNIRKGILPDLVDPGHRYVFSTGDYGIKDYWYVDMRGNYWKYTNAPEDSPDFDPYAGVPLLVRGQPMPAETPEFFTPDGRKRHIEVPGGIIPDQNPNYDPHSILNAWFEVFAQDGTTRYVYLDANVRENLDLFVQYQLRVTDAGLPRLRKLATDMLQMKHPKDRIVGAIIILVDQGLFTVEELLNATVGDLYLIDDTVKLLGRKFRCDEYFLDFLTSLTGPRDPSAPLFQTNTVFGPARFGVNHIYSVFQYLRVSPHYLQAWHASHIFSRIVNRLAAEEVPLEDVEGLAMSELQRVFASSQEVRYLVDYKVRKVLLDRYADSVSKGLGLSRFTTDDYATLMIYSDLVGRRTDEREFSEWLHNEPMHDLTLEGISEVLEMLGDEDESDGADNPKDIQDFGSVDTEEDQDVGTTDVRTE